MLGLVHHFFFGQMPQIRGVADLVATLCALAATIGLAMLSWKYFEEPFLKLGHSYRYRRELSGIPLARGTEAG